MLSQIKLRPLYFITAFILLIVMLIASFCFHKQDSFQFLNHFHNPRLDAFFIAFTWFGDGVGSIAAVIILASLNQRKQAVTVLIAYITSGLVSQIIKHLLNHPRPKLFFEESGIHFHFIQSITIYKEGSFPSGHSASAFALATVIALFYSDKRIGMAALLLAALEAYSRIYLGQHFLEDVAAGSFTGILFGMLSYYAVCGPKLPMFAKATGRKITPRTNDKHVSPV